MEKGKSKEWRKDLDKETSNQCGSYSDIQTRKKSAGCIVFLETEQTTDQNNGQGEIKLHCAISCSAYAEKCSSLEECRTNKQNNDWKGPIKKELSNHICGFETMMTDLEENRHNNNARKQKLERLGVKENGIQVAAIRDYFINQTKNTAKWETRTSTMQQTRPGRPRRGNR